MAQGKSKVVNRGAAARGNQENHGYFPDIAQPLRAVMFELERLGDVDFAPMDDWFKSVFSMEMPPCPKVSFSARREQVELAWRLLSVACELLQAVRVPSFAPGKLLSIEGASKTSPFVRVRALVPHHEGVNEQVVALAYQYANQLVRVLAVSGDAGSWFAVLDKIAAEFVQPWSRRLPGANSTIPLLCAAFNKNIPFRHLGQGVYRLGWGCNATLVDRSAIASDSAIGAKLGQDKFIAAQLLREAGLPAPEHFSVVNEPQALKAAGRLGWPVVVKPIDRDRGEGITVDVADEPTLCKAVNEALKLSKTVLIERQVAGVCHRLFVAKGEKVLFVSKRMPKSVRGDGIHSVLELIDKANAVEVSKAPWRRLKTFPKDEMAIESLASAGLTLASIPSAGQYAPLRRIQTDAWGGVVEELSKVIHPDNIDIALRAAALFKLDSAGIDVISPDISQPWHQNGAIINEVNYASLLGGVGRTGMGEGGYLSVFLDTVITGDGRIAVDVFVGGDGAMAAARQRHAEVVAKENLACYLTSHEQTLKPDGSELILAANGLFGRVQALLANRGVAALIMVLQSDEILYSGSPVDRITSLHWVDDHIRQCQQPHMLAPKPRCQGLLAMLQSFLPDQLQNAEPVAS